MDKEILIANLQMDDLKIHPDLHDLADISGLHFVQELYRNHTGSKFYTPDIRSNKPLIERFINENKHKYTEYQISRIIGWRIEQVRSVLYNRKK